MNPAATGRRPEDTLDGNRQTDGSENRVLMTGTVCNGPQTRRTPAGIPMTRFTLEHHSRQSVAGYPREARLRMIVLAGGEALSDRAGALCSGERVRVTGFLSRSDYRDDEHRVVLHAAAIERAASADEL